MAVASFFFVPETFMCHDRLHTQKSRPVDFVYDQVPTLCGLHNLQPYLRSWCS